MNSALSSLLFIFAACSLGNSVQGEKCTDGVLVGNTCYWLPYRTGPSVKYQKASDLCQFHGGILAEILTEEAYNAVYRYVKRSWYYDDDSDRVRVWLGAEFNGGSGHQVYTNTGGKGYVTWYPNAPFAGTSNIKMLITIATDPSRPAKQNGMWNGNPTVTAVPLCQFRFD